MHLIRGVSCFAEHENLSFEIYCSLSVHTYNYYMGGDWSTGP
jgi:hypothetical protein